MMRTGWRVCAAGVVAMSLWLAAEFSVGLVDSLAAFNDYVKAGGKLEDLMAQVNHPNRKGHDLVTRELLKWFVAPQK